MTKLEILQALADEYEYHREIVSQASDNPDMFIVTVGNRFAVITRRVTFIGAADLIVCHGRHDVLFDEYHPDSAKISEQASIIREQNHVIARHEKNNIDVAIRHQEHIQGLLDVSKRKDAQVSALLLSLQGARNLLGEVFSAITRDLVIDNTHRGRNELYRSIARLIDGWLSQSHEDMDDIPF